MPLFRKDFLRYPKLQEFNSYLKGLVNENDFNLTIKLKPIRDLDLENVSKWRTNEPIKLLTFIIDREQEERKLFEYSLR